MKDYNPDLIKIGETYIKFKFEYNYKNQALIRNAYFQQVGYSSIYPLKRQEFLKISIEFDKGSLKTRIVIWGTAIYMGIANYGSFRTGIREIIQDSKNFSEYVVEQLENDPEIHAADIQRVEKRAGLPGRIQDVYRRIDKLERDMNDLTNNEILGELTSIKQEISNLIEILPPHDSQFFLNELGKRYSQDLPDPDEHRTQYLMNRYGIKPEEDIEFIN